MTAQVPDLPDSELVFSRDRSSRTPLLQRGVTALVVAGLAAVASTAAGTPMLVIAGLIGLGAATCGLAYLWQGRFRTVLRPDGIHVRRYRSTVIP